MITDLLVEQHFHGGFGVDFNKASSDDIYYLSRQMLKNGVGYIFPTLVTDSVENIVRQIKIIKNCAQNQTSDMARICGIHLEGIFINPQKAGIHDTSLFLPPTIENYQKLEDDFIKIVTLAPELDDKGVLIKYLSSKGVKVQAGHCAGANLEGIDAVTHMFNAMEGISHRKKSTALTSLIDDRIYTEIIADGIHVGDDALKLLFKAKPSDKILLISDCLPCAKSDLKEFEFANHKICYDGTKATGMDGTLAGSSKILPEIIKILGQKGLFNPEFIKNSYKYHNLSPFGQIVWDDEFNIVEIKY